MNDIPVPAPRPYLLHNQIQHYAWGTQGEQAFIPHLLGIDPEPGCPYAELWMGTHPNAPSQVIIEGRTISLNQWITAYPSEILGAAVIEKFSGMLPFLCKVLSAGEALSIQAHPNKMQAEALHARDPEHYPDDNHKPEIAVALDSLTALMGIKPLPGILEALGRYPEIADFIGQDICNKLKRAKQPSPLEQQELVQIMFSKLITRSITHESGLTQAIDELAGRLRKSSRSLKEEEEIFLDLRGKYPGADVGLFAVFLLNLIHLTQGQGIFTQAGVPHAYLKGNIVECMANSDNVVRVGLTPKFKDAEALLTILDCEPQSISILEDSLVSEEVVYQTPASEFQVSQYRMKSHTERREVTEGKPEVFLLTKGELHISWKGTSETGEDVFRQGQSFFVPACLQAFRIQAKNPVELFKVEVP
jgi:mannose-6-phosphate isomerase